MALSTQSRHWRSAAAALELIRLRRDVTRREIADELGLASGGMSDLAGRLRAAKLIVERPASSAAPGRPSTTWHAHPDGPVALAVDLRHADWRLGVCRIDGAVDVVARGHHDGDAGVTLPRLRRRVTRAARQLSGRVVGVGVAVPGQTGGTRLRHASMLGWRDVELADIGAGTEAPVFAANDAAMAAVAEARAQRPTPRVLLHLVVEVGLGGALIVDGHPVRGASDLHGEFGHLPFGDPDLLCPCGARGCWGMAFDAREVARRVGAGEPSDPRAWLGELLQRADPSPVQLQLRAELAASLGRGAAGLVNAMDPEVVSLGGLADSVRACAPDRFSKAFEAGLMALHRSQPPEVRAAQAGAEAALVGVGMTAFAGALDAQWLARWAESHGAMS
jgi:predicted NBD/HSP70 family sugar kinase